MPYRRLSATSGYTLFGVLFGLVFPLGCLGLLQALGQLPVPPGGGWWPAVVAAHRAHVLLFVVDTAPLFLGLFARLAGVRQDRIRRLNALLERRIAARTRSLRAALHDARKANAAVLHLAQHDALTGLANRCLLRQRIDDAIARARASGTAAAVIFVDLDRFKAVNDAYGHAAGDQLLQVVATRLRSCVRLDDTVARLGGDEFVIVLADVDDAGGVERVVRKLLDAVGRPVALVGGTAGVSASVGVARFPNDGADAEALLRRADQAMYGAKAAGRDGRPGPGRGFAPADREHCPAA